MKSERSVLIYRSIILLPLKDRLSWTYAFGASIAGLFLIFSAIALMLAAIGLYAVIAHSMNRRTQEIGIRMAIGGTANDILKLVLRQGMTPAAIGLAIGLVTSLGVNPLLKAGLVRTSPNDPITLAIAFATLILAAMLGCLIPARRAMRTDPMAALRHD
jgi:ABC-type antimicrobial peptide transport system permease subunit